MGSLKGFLRDGFSTEITGILEKGALNGKSSNAVVLELTLMGRG